MNQRGFISNIVMIAVVFGFIFISQQDFAKPYGTWAFDQVQGVVSVYGAKLGAWYQANLSGPINGEVAVRGGVAKEKLEEQKNSLVQSGWEAVKNYFAAEFSKFFGTKVE